MDFSYLNNENNLKLFINKNFNFFNSNFKIQEDDIFKIFSKINFKGVDDCWNKKIYSNKIRINNKRPTLISLISKLNGLYTNSNRIYRSCKNNNCCNPNHLLQGYNHNIENHDFFDIIDTEKKAYWLGFFYADGYIHKNQNLISLKLSVKDKEHLEKFSKIFSSPVKYYNYQYSSANVVFSCKYMKESLLSLGIPREKTFSKNGSKILKNIPSILLNHFIRGIFDGDGCISIQKNSSNFSIVCGDYNFLYDIQKIIISKTKLNKTKIGKMGSIFKLQYSGNKNNLKIRNFLYRDGTIFLNRKFKKFQEI